MKQLLNKIVLGTAQFGLDYGINNKTGKIPKEEVYKILDRLKENSIDYIDTAQAYGDSENVLGSYIKNHNSSFKIISKIQDCAPNEVEIQIGKTLESLSIKDLYGLLLHSFDTYINDPLVYKKVISAKHNGLIEKAGFSLYYPNQLVRILDDNIEFDLVQIPYNLFDKRFEKYFPVLKNKGVEIHVRSVFLQGLFFMKPDELKGNLKELSGHLGMLKEISENLGFTIHELALLSAISNPLIDKAVIGVDNVYHLNDIITIANNKTKYEVLASNKSTLEKLVFNNETLLIPSNWN